MSTQEQYAWRCSLPIMLIIKNNTIGIEFNQNESRLLRQIGLHYNSVNVNKRLCTTIIRPFNIHIRITLLIKHAHYKAKSSVNEVSHVLYIVSLFTFHYYGLRKSVEVIQLI